VRGGSACLTNYPLEAASRSSLAISPARNDGGQHTFSNPDSSQAANIMHPFASLAAKILVIAAAGAGIYVASQYSDDRSSDWQMAAASSKDRISSEPARATTPSDQHLTDKPSSCASQTWPNISPECITGRAEPSKVAETTTIVPEQPSSILIRPTKLPEAVPDPEITGSLPQPRELAARQPARPVVANAKKSKAERRARADQRTLREAGRRNRFSGRVAVAERPALAESAPEPIQFRLAEGNR
jgi:hypothetical protein